MFIIHQTSPLLAPVLAKTADAAISDSAEAHAHNAAGLSSLGRMTHDRKALFVAEGYQGFELTRA